MSIQKLLTFTRDITRLLETHPGEEQILVDGSKLLATLVASDDWLPEIFAQPHPSITSSICSMQIHWIVFRSSALSGDRDRKRRYMIT